MTDTELPRQVKIAEAKTLDDLLKRIDPDPMLRTVRERRRHRRDLVLSMAFALVLLVAPAFGAYRFATAQTPIYEAQADVLFNIERAQFGEMETIMANKKILAERRDLAAVVADSARLDLDDFIERRTIEILESGSGFSGATSSVLRLKVENEDPAKAENQLGQLVEAFVAEQVSPDPDGPRREVAEGIIDDLQTRRIRAQADVEAAERAVDEADFSGLSTPRRAQAATELNNAIIAARALYEALIQDLNTQVRILEQLEPDGIEISVSTVGQVYVDDEPISPQPLRTLALGLALGAVLAVTFLFISFQLRSR